MPRSSNSFTQRIIAFERDAAHAASMVTPPKGRPPPNGRHRAFTIQAGRAWSVFTLIERLVIVSIVALLLSLLLPSLSKAREQAKLIECTSTLRAIATSSLTYGHEDPEEHVIPVRPLVTAVYGDPGAYDWGGRAGRGEPTKDHDPLSSMWGTAQSRGLKYTHISREARRSRVIEVKSGSIYGLTQAEYVRGWRILAQKRLILRCG